MRINISWQTNTTVCQLLMQVLAVCLQKGFQRSYYKFLTISQEYKSEGIKIKKKKEEL